MQANTQNILDKYQKRGTHSSLHYQLKQTIQNQQRFIQSISLKELQQTEQTKTIWIHLNQNNMHLCQSLNKKGFKIHKGLDNNISFYKWLRKDQDLVPPYSMFYIGCGGVIIDKNAILLVQQRNGPRKDEWGLAGGLLNRGQSIQQGVQRQIFEQTGYKTQFQYIIYFRQVNKYINDSIDIYFACYLKFSKGVSRQSCNFCTRQIKDHKWVCLSQLSQFLNNNKFNGTQIQVMNTIVNLYQKQFKFDEKLPNITSQNIINSRGIQKIFIEHKLILDNKT